MSASRRIEAGLAALAVVSAAGLASLALPARPLVLDEHAAYWLCAPDGELSIAARNLRYAATPPFASWCQALSLAVFGKSERALRLPSLLGYVAAVPLMYFGCRPFLGGLAAALAAVALAWHPDVVDEVRIGRTYGLVLLEMTAVLALTLQLAHMRGSPRRHALVAVAWGLVAAAAMWTHVLTIPAIALAVAALWGHDLKRHRRLRSGSVFAPIIAGVLALPLLPLLERMWEWRFALDSQTGAEQVGGAFGPFAWLAVPLAGLVALVGRDRSAPARAHALALWIVVMAGLVPLIILAIAGSELHSLNNPRYRVPIAAAGAALLGLLLGRARWQFAAAALFFAVAGCWMAAGRSPLTLARLDAPQAAAWREIGKVLERTVQEKHLEQAPVFVQGGLAEGALIPVMHQDRDFHEYLASRVGRFYAETPNPRYGLPFFWNSPDSPVTEFYRQRIAAAPSEDGDLFFALATDTDLNRESAMIFDVILLEQGYRLTRLADFEPWAILYHGRKEGPER